MKRTWIAALAILVWAVWPSAGMSTAQSGKPAPEAPTERVHLDEAAEAADLVHCVAPRYPEAHVEGVVVLDAIIAKDGSVQSLHAKSGHTLLIPAAMEAVREWRFRPHRINGRAVEVDTQIVVNFSFPPQTSDNSKQSREMMTAPTVYYSPQPPASDEALKGKVEGTVKLSIVVKVDGSVGDVHVVKRSGMGLDEEAIKTVRTWRFHPALHNGTPVKVRLLVEVVFHSR